MNQLIIDDLHIKVVRKNIKNIHLTVNPPYGRVRIAVPLSTDDETIRLFVISKLPWIKKSQRKFESQDRQTKRKFIERESHYFKGRRYLLRVFESDAPPKVVLSNKTFLAIYVRPGTNEEQCKRILNGWYRKQLKGQLSETIAKWEKIIGVSVLSWSIRQMKTRWGTCNTEKKSILINLELAKKPTSCLEYIVVHEIIHLLVRNHNEHFLFYMNKFMPNWRSLKEQLNSFPISHGEWIY